MPAIKAITIKISSGRKYVSTISPTANPIHTGDAKKFIRNTSPNTTPATIPTHIATTKYD